VLGQVRLTPAGLQRPGADALDVTLAEARGDLLSNDAPQDGNLNVKEILFRLDY
jgi:hypothetical protein